MKPWILFQFAPVGNFSRELKLVSETSAPVLPLKGSANSEQQQREQFSFACDVVRM